MLSSRNLKIYFVETVDHIQVKPSNLNENKKKKNTQYIFPINNMKIISS